MVVLPTKYPFLHLSWEIRDAIYSALLQCDERVPTKLPPSRTRKPIERPQLASAGMLCCSRQIHEELIAKMRLWQKKGRNIYKLHAALSVHGEPARFWVRVPVPLRYIHTLQLDISARGSAFYSRSVPNDCHKMIYDFFEHGPELGLVYRPKFWPLVDTILIDLPRSSSTKNMVSADDVIMESPLTAPISNLQRAAVSDILDSYHFDELREYLGRYIRLIQVRCEGYLFERSVEPDDVEI